MRGRIICGLPFGGPAATVVITVGVLVLAGCDSGPEEQESRGRDLTSLQCPMLRTGAASGKDQYRPAQNAFDTAELVGMPLDEARQKAASHGCEIIVALEDGNGQPVPIEVDPTTIYVYVKDGAVNHIERVGGGI
jgi:hypothetical protein